MNENGNIYSIRNYPSPNPHIRLDEVIYWSQGLRVKGLLARPKKSGNYEGLLYLRGGLQSIGMVRPARIAQFAAQGFVVFAPYYRGNRGGEGKDEFAGDDRFDASNGVDVLKQFVKQDNIHLYGFSRGGLMVLWTAILRDDIKSIVTWAGVSDATATYWERVDMRRGLKRIVGGTPNKVPENYDNRTPLFNVDQIDAPVLIIHGTEDQHVNIEHAYQLELYLKEEGKRVETWFSLGLRHHYPPKLNRATVHNLCQWMKQQ
ncbi:S9 family peptidase [Lysinibacillus sp. 2017]|uniref:alpha/beta hydrolase family protein n=1 Tax=unclassified Lysinibacillus TaxID=2636778 RepID=UPI000D5286BB|nr:MULTISPECIES: prolyl oligopeptidase family serine peptidase [unclassified Lysinibacillus]AWE08407.1 S9 family peptidase [Lysinibacillus sp. 2017]TGN35746.1 S9 family peptidase [Lysinibacillus sp. S2017]